MRGAVAGGQIGYNFQINNIVLGVEGDGSWTDMRDTVVEPLGPPPNITVTAESEVQWLATLRGRVGYAWDRFMIYGTGGAAWANVNVDVNLFGFKDSDSATHTGWTAGAGIEGMITESLSLKAEYLHAEFGKEKFGYFGSFNGKADLDVDIVRLGVNWHF